MGDKDVKSVVVSCKDALLQELQVDVKGLEPGAKGLVVLDKKSKGKSEPLGPGLAALDVKLYAQAEFELTIAQQPKTPPHNCVLDPANGMGKMNDAPTVGAIVTCVKLPTYQVKVEVLGLLGSGLVLSLNGVESLPVSPGEEKNVLFATRLLSGDGYLVVVEEQPLAPVQACEVAGGKGTVAGKDPENIVVICSASTGGPAYKVGGTVSGLDGSGFTLKNNGGIQEEIVPVYDKQGKPKEFEFAFSTPFADFATYDVSVSQQPMNKMQVCTVQNGYGKIMGGDVKDVKVVCQEAGMVVVDLVHPPSDGGHVKAMLIRAGKTPVDDPSECGAPTEQSGKWVPPPNAASCKYVVKPEDPWRLAAREPYDTRLKNNKAMFFLVDASIPANSPDADAHLIPGDYFLYVLLNSDGGTLDTGKPDFNTGDWGFYDKVTVKANQMVTRKILEEEFFAAVQPGFGGSESIPNDVTCYWSPAGSAPFPVPASPMAPVLSVYKHVCTKGTSGQYQCVGSFSLPLIKAGAQKDVEYAVTCINDYEPKGGGPGTGSADHWYYWPACTLPQTGLGVPCTGSKQGNYYW